MSGRQVALRMCWLCAAAASLVGAAAPVDKMATAAEQGAVAEPKAVAPAPDGRDLVQYELLLPYQFEARVKACPLVYVPVGSLEWHGEHLAIGNDSIKIHALCCAAARRGGGVVFPPIYFGIPGMTAFGKKYEVQGNIPVPEELLRQLLNTTLDRLERNGFRAAILITGHTPRTQIELMHDVAKKYQGKMVVYGTADNEWAKDLSFTSDHAAKWETSILMHLRPELVDMSRLPKDLNTKLEGVGGQDPRVYASPELGKRVVEALARDLAALGKKLLEQANQAATTRDKTE